MPFTYAHPALVVPFVRASDARGWRSSLVLGAMAPDLARMIPVWGTRELSHSLSGLLLVDVPLAIALTLVWSLWFAPRAVRLPGLEAMEHPWTPASRFLIPLGALLGSVSHLLWDLITHGPPIFQWAFLDIELFQTVAGPFRVRNSVWFVHSFAGLGILGWCGARLVKRSPHGLRSLLHPSWRRIVLAGILPLGASITWIDMASPTLFVDFFESVFYGNRGRGIQLLVVATSLFFAAFWWETRERGDSKKG